MPSSNQLHHQLHAIIVQVDHLRVLIRLRSFIPQWDLHHRNVQTNRPRYQRVPNPLWMRQLLLQAESVGVKNLLLLPFRSLMQRLRKLCLMIAFMIAAPGLNLWGKLVNTSKDFALNMAWMLRRSSRIILHVLYLPEHQIVWQIHQES